MKVKVLPARFMRDSRPYTDQAQFLGSKARGNVQSDYRYGWTLALMGSSYGETESIKVT